MMCLHCNLDQILNFIDLNKYLVSLSLVDSVPVNCTLEVAGVIPVKRGFITFSHQTLKGVNPVHVHMLGCLMG